MAAEYLERMGARMRERRTELGMTRGDVARAMPGKTNENAIYRWEKGQHRPEDDALEALAGVLQVSGAGWFFAEEKAETPDPFEDAIGLAELVALVRQDMAERQRQRGEIIQRLDNLERVLMTAIKNETRAFTDETAERLLRLGQEVLRGASSEEG